MEPRSCLDAVQLLGRENILPLLGFKPSGRPIHSLLPHRLNYPSYLYNRPWGSIGFSAVEVLTFSRQSAHRWQ
jgi:hypothetical protein